MNKKIVALLMLTMIINSSFVVKVNTNEEIKRNEIKRNEKIRDELEGIILKYEDMIGYTEGKIKIIWFILIEGKLIVNMGEDIKRDKNSSYENVRMGEIMLRTLLQLEYVDEVTIYVGGKLDYIGSGLIIEKERKWVRGEMEEN